MSSEVWRWRSWFGGAAEEKAAADPLVARLQAGDHDAVAEAYDRYHARVRGFARRLLGDNAAAEDLVQDTFVSLPSAVKRFRGDSSLGTFLVSVAINHARHHVRSAVRRRGASERLATEPLPAGSASADPERTSQQRELSAALVRALDTLPLDQRVAFVLCEVEEHTSGDAARILEVPEGTVRTRVFHARKKLREHLEGEGVR